MRPTLFRIALLFIASVLGLQACSSSAPTYYYMLKADASSEQVPNKQLALSVGPVYLADYLQRQGVVLRNTEVNYQISDTELWAGQLDNDINIVILQNLQRLTGSEQLRPFATIGLTPQPSLRIKIDRLDSDVNGQSRLQGSWQLLSAEGRELDYQSFALTTSNNNDTASRVAAISALLNELSLAIAKRLTNGELTH